MKKKTVTVRFAPSPTGYLHIGNVRTALLNWLYAEKHKGRFILRFDDTDRERSREEYIHAIRQDLLWLGLAWDQEYHQSARLALYDAAAQKLRASGRLYACYETAEELEIKRRMQLSRHQPPVYDRAALKLTQQDHERFEAEGKQPHWRFKLEEQKQVEWHDLVRGPSHFDMASLSDPVLIREDGSYLYMLPSVVDDIDMEITHVIRGEDHVTNSAVQIQLFEALDAVAPTFAHLALIADAEGEGLSKRAGSMGVSYFREQGYEPLAILSLLARLGSADPVEPHILYQDLIDGFHLEKFGRATAKYDVADIDSLNQRILHQLPFEAVTARLGEEIDEAMWLAVRPNIAKLADVATWRKVILGPMKPVIEDEDFANQAAKLLPAEPWQEGTWKNWTQAVKDKTSRKGAALFKPLRLALTGLDHGPEMAVLLPLIGRARAEKRLNGFTA